MRLLHLRLPYRAHPSTPIRSSLPAARPPPPLPARPQTTTRQPSGCQPLQANANLLHALTHLHPRPTTNQSTQRCRSSAVISPVHFPSPPSPSSPTSQQVENVRLPVSILHSPRGGLTTYHGPGQVVLWPILDLNSAQHNKFTVRCYTRLLEKTTIATLAQTFGLKAFTTEDPGVWVRSGTSWSPSNASEAGNGDESCALGGTGEVTDGGENGGGPLAKIAALGVHLRRHVSGLGTAINVDMPGPEVTAEEVNPWARFVACGLEGKTVTSVKGELVKADAQTAKYQQMLNPPAVADRWAETLARNIGVEDVQTVGEEEVVRVLEELVSGGGKGSEELEVGEEERRFVRMMKEELERGKQ